MSTTQTSTAHPQRMLLPLLPPSYSMPSLPPNLHQHHMPFPTMFFAPLLATQQRSSTPSVFSDSLRCSTFQLAIRGMSRSSPLPPHPESSFLALTPCHHPDMSPPQMAPQMHPMIADNMRYDYLELRCDHFNPLRRGRGTSKSRGIVPAADFLGTSVACGGRSESLPPQQSGRNTTDITISGGSPLPATARAGRAARWCCAIGPREQIRKTKAEILRYIWQYLAPGSGGRAPSFLEAAGRRRHGCNHYSRSSRPPSSTTVLASGPSSTSRPSWSVTQS
jgi:hypothetical protein